MAEDALSFDQVQRYLAGLVPPRPKILMEMEEYAREHDFPIIGPACGHFCYLIARLSGARSVFELGSGFGYSTAWFARAVTENGGGVVHHVVWDEELSQQARTNLEQLGYGQMIRYHVGEAVAALRNATGPFDLIFNDIDKEGYPGSIPVIEDKLRAGGVLIIDNFLWSGRIFDDADRSPETEGIRESTRILHDSDRWTATVVPIRDGLLLARKA